MYFEPQPCPSLSAWGEWTACSVSCGVGQRKHYRTCSEYGLCDSAELSEPEKCNEQVIVEIVKL